MRRGFTLIELMISIVILSIMMLFLYKSYAQLNKSNRTFADEAQKLSKLELVKKTIYYDYSLAIKSAETNATIAILNQSKKEDVVLMQSSHSIHNRINPYVAYLVKEKKLYRLESLKPLTYPLGVDSEFVSDELGEVKSFRVYNSKDSKKGLYLVHILFVDGKEILLKIKALNMN